MSDVRDSKKEGKMIKKAPATTFDTELFKRSVLYNVKTLYRKTLEEATDQQIFQAVSYAIKDAIVDQWLKSQKEYDRQDPKDVPWAITLSTCRLIRQWSRRWRSLALILTW